MAGVSAALLLATDWVGITLGAGIGIVATLIAGWLFLRLQEKRAAPRLVYRSRSHAVVGSPGREQESEIEIHYRGTIVPRVTQTRLVLWNAGHLAIKSEDIPEGAPVKIRVGDGAILLATVVQESSSAIRFALDIDDTSVECTFDFLDSGDGAVFDIVHTASESDPLTVTGTVIGMGGPPHDYGLYVGYASRRQLLFPVTLLLVVLTAITVFAIRAFVGHDWGGGGAITFFGIIIELILRDEIRPMFKQPPSRLDTTTGG